MLGDSTICGETLRYWQELSQPDPGGQNSLHSSQMLFPVA